MMSVPPVPPLKSSQRLSAPARSAATVRAVEGTAEPGLPTGPSMRRPAFAPHDDPRRLVQGAVRQAAMGSTDRPIIDRGRPRISVQTLPRRQDSTRSPPGTRTPADLTWEDGFSYIDQDDTSILPDSPVPLQASAARRPLRINTSPSHQIRQRAGSFESGKPKGLSFHDAREFMRSGRGRRPGSWHEAPVKKAARVSPGQHYSEQSTPASRSPSPRDARSRTPSPSDQSRQPMDDEEDLTEVSFDGSPLRPLGSHPPVAEDSMENMTAIHASARSGPRVTDAASPPLENPAEMSRRSVHWQTTFRRHIGATLGEFLGTTSFLFTAFGGAVAVSSSSLDPSIAANSMSLIGFNVPRLIYMSFAFGFSYMVNVWVFFHVSEGLFNPAVTLALLITGSHDLLRSLLLLIAQLSGSIAASALTLGVFQTLDPVRTEPAVGVSIPRGLFIEAILTAQLVLVILLFARDKQKATIATPIVIGLALLASELVAIFWTGGSLNPARSFGPNVVSWRWASTHWIYWAGPLLGSVIAVILLRVLQALTFELRTEDDYEGHFSPPCQHPPMFERGKAMTGQDFKGLRLDIPHGAFSPVVSSDLTGVINLWQTRPGGRFRGNSLAHASNAPQIGRGDGEG